MVKDLLQSLIPIINFSCGIAFFLAGFIILFQFTRIFKSGFSNIRSLGVFFLLQGIALWLVSYYQTCSEYSVKLQNFELLLNALSYYFLLVFGIYMQMQIHKKNGIIKHLPKLILLCWIILLGVLSFSGGTNNWRETGDITLKYFFAFPGALLTGLALKTKRFEIKNNYEVRLGKLMQRAYIAFLVYALAIVVIVPGGIFLITIEYLRGISGIILAYCTVVILEIFYLDHFQKVEMAEKEATIFAERERISHDIHDGTMQALYGIGLRLQYINSLLKTDKDDVVKEHLRYAMQKLNETSQEIRGYITNLSPHRENIKLVKEINDVTRDFISETNIPVSIDYKQITENISIKEEIITQIIFVIKEILNNVRKHAAASLVRLAVVVSTDKIEISIEDDGRGFEYKEEDIPNKGIGLRSIKKRVTELNGSFKITSKKDAGSLVSIEIPLEDE